MLVRIEALEVAVVVVRIAAVELIPHSLLDVLAVDGEGFVAVVAVNHLLLLLLTFLFLLS